MPGAAEDATGAGLGRAAGRTGATGAGAVTGAAPAELLGATVKPGTSFANRAFLLLVVAGAGLAAALAVLGLTAAGVGAAAGAVLLGGSSKADRFRTTAGAIGFAAGAAVLAVEAAGRVVVLLGGSSNAARLRTGAAAGVGLTAGDVVVGAAASGLASCADCVAATGAGAVVTAITDGCTALPLDCAGEAT